jgi:hypothetical protein
MQNAERIEFESATLFTELVEKGQLKNLISVKSATYPKYCFKKNEKVADIVGKFITSHDLKCDRSIDDCWNDFDKQVLNAEEKTKCIVTRNLNAVKRIVYEGYGYMLKRTCVDQYKKKCFIFHYNDRISEIKDEEDAINKAKYENKHTTSRKETADTQMSVLIKKAMEDKNNGK